MNCRFYAGGRTDFARWRLEPKSASSILQALSCRFFGCNLLQWRNFFKSKAVSCKVDRDTETVILRFLYRTGEILETEEFFPRHFLINTHIYIFAPVRGLLEYARILGFGHIFVSVCVALFY